MLNLLHLKLYYRFFELTSISPIENGALQNSNKNCFIYYDYEREFSGHKTDISNSDIEHIIGHLSEINLKTTWFTVGKVIEKYPETISKLVENGHEIGSHTYSHIAPKEMNRINLKKDFERFEEERSKIKLLINGFHSPKGQWTVSIFDHLRNNNFSYDVIFLPFSEKKIQAMKFKFFKTQPVIRLVTLGDDWPLFEAKKSRLEVFEYFKELYVKTKPGDTFGIGFHPWILYSDKNILSGYKDFLSYITQQDNIILKPAADFVEKIKQTYDLSDKI